MVDYVTKYYFCCKNDKKKGGARERGGEIEWRGENDINFLASPRKIGESSSRERSPLFWFRLKPNLLDTEKSHYELTAAIDFLSPCGYSSSTSSSIFFAIISLCLCTLLPYFRTTPFHFYCRWGWWHHRRWGWHTILGSSSGLHLHGGRRLGSFGFLIRSRT